MPPEGTPLAILQSEGDNGPFFKVSYTWRWIALLSALFAFASLIAYNLYKDRRDRLATEDDRLMNQARVVDQIVSEEFKALDAVLRDLSTEWASGTIKDDLDRRFKTLGDAIPGVRVLLLLDAGGTVRAVNRTELKGQNFSDRDYFRRTAQDPAPETLHVSPPYQTSLGAYVITVSLRIVDEQGRFLGVIAASLDPAYFLPLLDSILYAPDMWAMLVHGQGTLFLISPQREDMLGKNLGIPGTLFTRHIESRRACSVFMDTTHATGQRLLLVARNIAPPFLRMDHPLVIGISRDPEAILADWRTSVFRYAGAYTLLALASCLGLALYQRSRRQFDRLRERTAQALVDSERFLRTLTDNIPGMVGYWDADLRCRFANAAYLEWFGRTREQMRGIRIQELLGGELFRKNEAAIRAALRGVPQRFERDLVKTDGTVHPTLVHYIPDQHGERVLGFYVLVTDVSELKSVQHQLEEMVRKLEVLANTDALTGVPNRRRFMERAEEEFARSARYGAPLGFLMLDIDHFKAVNDTLGHDAGDEVLKAVSRASHDALRGTDVLGRLGGEEFGVLLVQTGPEEALAVAERLRARIAALDITTTAGPVRVTVSLGLTAWTDIDLSPEDLMRRADAALYAAKRAGRNRVESLISGSQG